MPLDVVPNGRLVLEGVLTMRTAEDICAKLLETVSEFATISIDCSAATEVDLTFVQLLVAARASAAPSQKTVVLESCPDGALLETLTRGGFVTTEDRTGDGTSFWFDGAPA